MVSKSLAPAVALIFGFLFAAESPARQEPVPTLADESPKAYFGMTNDYVETGNAEGRIKVTEIVEGSPAAAAGLQAGDLIHTFDGATFRFRNRAHYIRSLWSIVPGEPLNLGVIRRGEPLTLTIVPTAMDPERRADFARFVANYDTRCAEGNCGDCNDPPLRTRSERMGTMLLYRRVQSTRKPVVVTIS